MKGEETDRCSVNEGCSLKQRRPEAMDG